MTKSKNQRTCTEKYPVGGSLWQCPRFSAPVYSNNVNLQTQGPRRYPVSKAKPMSCVQYSCLLMQHSYFFYSQHCNHITWKTPIFPAQTHSREPMQGQGFFHTCVMICKPSPLKEKPCTSQYRVFQDLCPTCFLVMVKFK